MKNDTKLLLAIAKSVGFDNENPLNNLWELKEYLFNKLDEYKNKVYYFSKMGDKINADRYSGKFDSIYQTLNDLLKNSDFIKCYQ